MYKIYRMATHIKCPNCASVFDVEDVLSADVEQKLKQRYEKQLQESISQLNTEKKKLEDEQRSFDEKKKKENELFQQKLQQEKLKLETEIQQQVRKSIAADYENQLRLLQHSVQDNEEKLKLARQKELEFLKKEQELKKQGTGTGNCSSKEIVTGKKYTGTTDPERRRNQDLNKGN